MFRFAQHDRFVNAAAKTGAHLPPTFGQCLRWLRSPQRLRGEDDSRTRTDAIISFYGSDSRPGNGRECFLRRAFSSAIGDRHWRTGVPRLECAEASARQENPSEVARVVHDPVDKSLRVLSPNQRWEARAIPVVAIRGKRPTAGLFLHQQ